MTSTVIEGTIEEGLIEGKQAIENLKAIDSKDTVTTLESILSGNDLKQFKAAQKTWDTMPKTALTMLSKMEKVGHALNTLYNKGIEKGLKRDNITIMARLHFKGLDRRERSEYRKLANNAKEISLFIDFAGVKSANPTYLVNAWVKAVKEDCEACRQIESALQGGFDASGQPMAKEPIKPNSITGLGVTEPVKHSESITIDAPLMKQGITNIVTPEALTPNEATQQLGFIINQIKTMYNRGKLSADNLGMIEKHLTTCLQHINNIDADNDIPLAM